MASGQFFTGRPSRVCIGGQPWFGNRPCPAVCNPYGTVYSVCTGQNLGAGAVLQIHNQRVVERALLELRHNLADAAVHVVDHRRVHFHVADVPFLLGAFSQSDCGDSFRSLRINPSSLAANRGADLFESRRRIRPCSARYLPAGMHRPMRRGMGHVEKHRFVR